MTVTSVRVVYVLKANMTFVALGKKSFGTQYGVCYEQHAKRVVRLLRIKVLNWPVSLLWDTRSAFGL